MSLQASPRKKGAVFIGEAADPCSPEGTGTPLADTRRPPAYPPDDSPPGHVLILATWVNAAAMRR